ncbi:MAG TPA: ribose-phosphate pyrophosphokinase [Gemmatimonadales bacterium]|nr:ribose-phosphate pyrophosphokinase [Gemmatimonadales bacterium]
MRLLLLAGSAHLPLAERIARALAVSLADRELSRFPDGEMHVEVRETVRDADVYLLQPTAPPIEANLLQLLLLADACRRGGAMRVTAVIPYFGYARQDRRATGREAVGARVIAETLHSAGIDRVVAVHLHTAGLEAVFSMPVEHLTAVPILATALASLGQAMPGVVVAPDAGAIKLAQYWARALNLPTAVVHKIRVGGEAVTTHGVTGEVRGRRPLIVDDMISTGGTVAAAITALLEAGAVPECVVAATHGLFVGSAVEQLAPLPITHLLVTDTVCDTAPADLAVQRVTVAPLIANAITRLHQGRSLSDLILHV